MRTRHLPDASVIASWRASSYSGNDKGSECVEVADDLPWRKSSYSGDEPRTECVEVADGLPGVVPVRDSKNPTGPALLVNPHAWQAFVTHVSR